MHSKHDAPNTLSLRSGWSLPTSRTAEHRGRFLCTEDRCFTVPKGQSTIAQRFNAGLDAKGSRVPKGRLRANRTPHPSTVPGLVCNAGCFPALKRRAIFKMSLRDTGTWLPPFPPGKQPDSRAMPARPIRSYGVRRGRCGTWLCQRCPAEKNVGLTPLRSGTRARERGALYRLRSLLSSVSRDFSSLHSVVAGRERRHCAASALFGLSSILWTTQ